MLGKGVGATYLYFYFRRLPRGFRAREKALSSSSENAHELTYECGLESRVKNSPTYRERDYEIDRAQSRASCGKTSPTRRDIRRDSSGSDTGAQSMRDIWDSDTRAGARY